MSDDDLKASQGQRLIQSGVTLFLLGLLTGFAVPALQNPRMGLSSHLEGIMNGFMLILFGLIWPRLALKKNWLSMGFWLALYSAFANWLATLFAAIWGAGELMSIAGGRRGSAAQELIINGLLYSLSLTLVIVCVILLVGLARTNRNRS